MGGGGGGGEANVRIPHTLTETIFNYSKELAQKALRPVNVSFY